MNSKYIITQITGGALIPILMAFLGEAITQMIPWFIAIFTVIMADLISGVWKSFSLEIPVRFSRACRETMGKMIVYFAFVCMACCINVAEKGEFNWARWIALFVIVLELGSMASNVLKPHGINVSLNAIMKAFLHHSLKELTCPEVDDILRKESLEDIRKEELDKLREPEKLRKNGKGRDNKSS